jgi:hypothetical protein
MRTAFLILVRVQEPGFGLDQVPQKPAEALSIDDEIISLPVRSRSFNSSLLCIKKLGALIKERFGDLELSFSLLRSVT